MERFLDKFIEEGGDYGFLIFILLYMIAIYIKKWLEFKAVKSENLKLVNQTEKIKSHYVSEIEKVRSEYQSNIEKRKYQYECKKDEYFKFFKLLDDFSKMSNDLIFKKTNKIVSDFLTGVLDSINSDNSEAQKQNFADFSLKFQGLVFELNRDLLKVKNETNTIKLIASDSLLIELEKLEQAYEDNVDISIKIIEEIAHISEHNKPSSKNIKKLNLIALKIQNIKDNMIKIMRVELDEF